MEIWDLYDENLELTGETMVRGDEVPEGRFHLVIHIWIINAKGEHLIQKRSQTVSTGAGKWALTGGSAQKGETSKQAIVREVKEEIGIEITEPEITSISRKLKGQFFLEIWLLKKDISIEAFTAGEEVEAVRFANEKEIRAMVEKDDFWDYHKVYLDQMFAVAMG